mgnify:CR=1 FL=1
MSTPLRHAYAVSGSISDLLPKGFIDAPGTATFSDGTTAAAHSEVITPQPDGSTKITWSGFAITAQPASSASISVIRWGRAAIARVSCVSRRGRVGPLLPRLAGSGGGVQGERIGGPKGAENGVLPLASLAAWALDRAHRRPAP